MRHCLCGNELIRSSDDEIWYDITEEQKPSANFAFKIGIHLVVWAWFLRLLRDTKNAFSNIIGGLIGP